MAWTTDLFAPPYVKGEPSEEEFKRWFAKYYGMTRPLVEGTRTPVSFNTGDPRGMVDPEALRVHAQGGPYDMNARRNSVAAAVLQQQAAAPAGVQRSPYDAGRITPVGGGVFLPEFDTSQAYSPYQSDPRFAPVQGYGGGGVGGSS